MTAAVPVILCWYGLTHCLDLACVGPLMGVILDLLVVVPLLVIWILRPRPVPLAMLLCAEGAMAVATFGRSFDFSPQFRLIFVPIGLACGALLGLGIRSASNPSREAE